MSGDEARDLARAGVIRTPRLDLVEMSSAVVAAVLAQEWQRVQHLVGAAFPSEWRDDGWHWLEQQRVHGETDDRFIQWGTRLALSRSHGADPASGLVLAEVGFHGPPDADGWAEIGYRVVTSHRRQGLAEEAVRALMRWAGGEGIVGIKASVNRENAASLSLLHKLGFIEAGSSVHPALGEQLVFRRSAGLEEY